MELFLIHLREFEGQETTTFNPVLQTKNSCTINEWNTSDVFFPWK